MLEIKESLARHGQANPAKVRMARLHAPSRKQPAIFYQQYLVLLAQHMPAGCPANHHPPAILRHRSPGQRI